LRAARFPGRFPEKHLISKAARDDLSFVASGSGKYGVSSSPTMWMRSRTVGGANTWRLSPLDLHIANIDSDRDSHGVSDLPDGRRATSGARSGVAHAMVSSSDWTETLDCGRQRAPPVSRTLAPTTPKSLSTNRMRAAAGRAGDDARQPRRDACINNPGDDLISGGRPRGRPHL
jgi:hypothetical protein